MSSHHAGRQRVQLGRLEGAIVDHRAAIARRERGGSALPGRQAQSVDSLRGRRRRAVPRPPRALDCVYYS